MAGGVPASSALPEATAEPRARGELAGKVALITGAANGIGRRTAERFVAEGACVILADVADGEELADRLGSNAVFCPTDVTDRHAAERAVLATVETFGRLDILCNVAGVSGALRRFLDDDLRDFERVVTVDLLGVLLMSQCAARRMVEQGGGAIVNVASGAGITPGVGMQPYRAAKAGVVHLTRSLAVELGEHGIRVNCVAPANIATDINAAFDKASVTRLQPLPHQGVPDDVADALVFLAGDRSAHITGVVLPIDGGMSVGTPPRLTATRSAP